MEKINSIFNSGLNGIHRRLQQMDQTANNIAKSGTTRKGSDAANIATELVDLKTEALDIKASLKVLKTGEDLLGTFLDEFA